MKKLAHNNKKYPVEVRDRKFYYVWKAMKKRCFDKNDKSYERYGAKGIKVCKRWINFVNFYKDMYRSYIYHIDKYGIKDTQLDRINSKKYYKPSNCRWVKDFEQRRNKGNNIYIKIDGKIKILADWIKYFNLKKVDVSQRIYKYKINPKDALLKTKDIYDKKRAEIFKSITAMD